MLPFRIIETPDPNHPVPMYCYSIGQHDQRYLARPSGFPAYQIFLTRSGRGIIRFDHREEIILEPGTAMVIPSKLPHEYFPMASEVPWELGYVGFQGGIASSLLDQLGFKTPKSFPILSLPVYWNELHELWRITRHYNEAMLWDVSKRLYSLLVSLREETQRIGQRDLLSPESSPNAALLKAVQLMHNHYAEPLRISNLAHAVGYSVQHFQRLFLTEFETTPHDYFQRIRMQRAIQFLQDHQEATVQETAQHLSMESSYFIRLFKKVYGTTPKLFHERYWSKKEV